MKHCIYIIIVFAVITIVIQHQHDIRDLKILIKSQNQLINAMQISQRNISVETKLALTIGRNTQQSLHDARTKRIVKVTAYSPRKTETDSTPFTTAYNTKVRPGIIAVSRDLFAKGWTFGRKVYIKSLGVFTIEDLMAKRKKNQIDIFIPETTKAIAFGRKNMEAHLLAQPTTQQETYTSLYSSPTPDFLLTAENFCEKKP